MLSLSNVHAHYGLSHVLQGVSFTVGTGEIIGLFGRNGVGKTTTLRTIAGWLEPSSGSIRIGESEIAGAKPDDIAQLGIGFVPEDRRIFPGLTVDENMRLGLRQNPSLARKQKEENLARSYERFPKLWERRSQMGTTLSGGEQQMLAIARVLAGRPTLMLIDEPTEGLAPQIVDEIFQIMQELKAEGMTTVLVEQNVRWALGLADRILAMERGQITFHAEEVTERETAQLMEHLSI